MGIARRHDDRRGDLGAVDQRDAADAVAAAHDRVDRALGPQHAACGLERGEQGGGHLTAAADRSSLVWIVYFVQNYWLQFLTGAGVTLLIALSGTLVGFAIGLIIGIMLLRLVK